MSNTPAVPTTTAVAVRDDMPDGLEDISVTDMTLPIIRTIHKEGCFRDPAGEDYTEFDAIILGVIKQRVLWPTEPGESGEMPVCRAVDFKTGHPDLAKFLSKDAGTTAQKKSGFTLAEVNSAVEDGTGLACANCQLKEWKTNPKDQKSPWCTEQWTMPVLRINEDGSTSAAIISFQRTGLKPCRNYVSSFTSAKLPLYTAVTRIRALAQSKGSVDFVTPRFSKVSETDRSEWPTYSQTLHDIRDYLITPRFREDEDEQTTTKDEDDEVIETQVIEDDVTDEGAPAPAKRVAPKATKPEPEPVVADDEDDDDEEPF